MAKKKDELIKEEMSVEKVSSHDVVKADEVEDKTSAATTEKIKSSVVVKLKVKQLINGKYGFTDGSGVIKLLSDMPFSFEPQEVDATVWDEAEIYKVLRK